MPRKDDRHATVHLLLNNIYRIDQAHLTWDNGDKNIFFNETAIDNKAHTPSVHNFLGKGNTMTLSWHHPTPHYPDTEWVDFLNTGGKFGTENWIDADKDVGHAKCQRGNWTNDGKGGPNRRDSYCLFKC